jgi:hypothetical protein
MILVSNTFLNKAAKWCYLKKQATLFGMKLILIEENLQQG